MQNKSDSSNNTIPSSEGHRNFSLNKKAVNTPPPEQERSGANSENAERKE